MAGYTAQYSSTEISEPVVDLLITIIAGLVGFGTLVALVLIIVWFKGKGVKMG